MLVITRRKDESVVIDNDITITVFELSGNRVRLGIEAPQHISIHRGEVQDRIDRENPHWRGTRAERDDGTHGGGDQQ